MKDTVGCSVVFPHCAVQQSLVEDAVYDGQQSLKQWCYTSGRELRNRAQPFTFSSSSNLGTEQINEMFSLDQQARYDWYAVQRCACSDTRHLAKCAVKKSVELHNLCNS